MKNKFIMSPKEPLKRSYFRNNRFWVGILLVILFLIVYRESVAGQQSVPVLFHGIILDNETNQPLEGAHYRIRNRHSGAADLRGMVSFYAHTNDTIIFSCIGYKDAYLVVRDTLADTEYTAGIFLSTDTLMIPGVVVVPRMMNVMQELKSNRPAPDQNTINAINNLKISTYQGLKGANELGDPAANYELLRNKQRMEAFEKGGIPSDRLVSLSPFTLIPVIYVLAKGLPQDPEPPQPYISPRELQYIKSLRDSIMYRKK